jgi:LysM repeat protein
MAFIYFPQSVQAGIFSFVSGLFSGEESQHDRTYNSQNVALLQAAINIDPTSSLGGGDITVVGDSALLAENSPYGGWNDNLKDHPTSDQINVYVVREGDSLSQIAQMFGVSVNTIRWSNDINGSAITPGETLVILPVSGVRHIVKSGDTLKSITKKYGGDIDEVMSYNSVTKSSKLAVGSVIIVPDGEIVAQSSSSGTTISGTRAISSSKEYVGYYLKPINGIRTQGPHGYNGIDLAAPAGTPIVASASGKVIISRSGGWNGGYGNYVVIKHDNGTQTLYAHNSRNIVFQGADVVQGQVIAYVGTTGKSTGPHVHFEVRGAKNPF